MADGGAGAYSGLTTGKFWKTDQLQSQSFEELSLSKGPNNPGFLFPLLVLCPTVFQPHICGVYSLL